MTAASSILLADDHGLVRHGFQLLIGEILPEVRVQLAQSLAEASEMMGRTPFDLVLLDLTLGDAHGMAGLARLRDERPYVPVVVLSAQDDRDTVRSALEAGAMGFISKAASPSELKEALVAVLVERVIHLPKSVSEGFAAAPAQEGRDLADLSALGLTERQIEVVGHVARGLTNKEIARLMNVSEQMVKQHLSPSLKALGATNRAKLMVILSQRGYRVPRLFRKPDSGQ